MSLADLHFDAPDGPCWKRANSQIHHGEESLAGYLAHARRLVAERPERIAEGRIDLPEDFEALRHFTIAEACLRAHPGGTDS
ncbi:hypothetical protein ACIG0C_21140 [Kitasatospora aureofaciens]|uniref:Uncharacterized protein n=1 Tax=Kitasatospora aureofaciens TaxID=1894 RepID=A0A1E7N281_KITAU|nr:hypothetical protein [Kitasatospora aureofaciens]ARF81841.1 hypothetical protein B6264_25745 [Kitasatospora aureofaciens]OEV34797.1 hypothetical protein HS99_0009995 [Kitasatospora aureofaciens]GGU92541.1 hypothetical protein GCM10010502_52520 [Kitasatospora aureofaciens]